MTNDEIDTTSAGKRVLLVDDEETIRQVFSLLLEDYGHEVSTAANGAEALALLKPSPDFDIVVTDRMMPEMDGGTLASEVKRCWPQIPVVMISGRSSGEMRSIASGVDCFLRKPFTVEELRATMARAVTLAHAAAA